MKSSCWTRAPILLSVAARLGRRYTEGKTVRLPKLVAMPGFDLDRLEKAAELLALAFYGLMLLALATVVSGSAGWGFLFLALGSCAHVGRAAFEEFVEAQRARAKRSKPERRLEPQPANARPRRSSQPDDEFVITATRERRAAKLGG
jgi:hypothetical protein